MVLPKFVYVSLILSVVFSHWLFKSLILINAKVYLRNFTKRALSVVYTNDTTLIEKGKYCIVFTLFPPEYLGIGSYRYIFYSHYTLLMVADKEPT